MDWVAIDFETATGSRSSACALGLAEVVDGRVASTRSWLIQPPGNEYSEWNVRVHGIAPRATAEAPAFDEVWPEIHAAFEDGPLVAHNASFDVSVLRATLDFYGLAHPRMRYLCTLQLSRAYFADMPSHRLPLVAERCGLHLEHHHDAACDAVASAEIALYLCDGCRQGDILGLASELNVTPGEIGPRGSWSCWLRSRPHRDVPDPLDIDDRLRGALSGLRFVLTGGLTRFTRDEATSLLEAYGARVCGSVSRLTSFVVVGSDPGSKYDKAVELGVPILDEAALLRTLETGEPPAAADGGA